MNGLHLKIVYEQKVPTVEEIPLVVPVLPSLTLLRYVFHFSFLYISFDFRFIFTYQVNHLSNFMLIHFSIQVIPFFFPLVDMLNIEDNVEFD